MAESVPPELAELRQLAEKARERAEGVVQLDAAVALALIERVGVAETARRQLAAAALAFQELNAVYRTHGQPSEALFTRLQKARAALAAHGQETDR